MKAGTPVIARMGLRCPHSLYLSIVWSEPAHLSQAQKTLDTREIQFPGCWGLAASFICPRETIGPLYWAPLALWYSSPRTYFHISLLSYTPLEAEPCCHSSLYHLIQNSVDSTVPRYSPSPVPTLLLPFTSHLIISSKMKLISHGSTHRIRTDETPFQHENLSLFTMSLNLISLPCVFNHQNRPQR